MNRRQVEARSLWLLASCTVIILLLAACTPPRTPAAPVPQPSSASPVATQAKPKVKIKAGAFPSVSYAVFYIAQAEGYFAEQGLDVELVPVNNTGEIVPLMLDGQLDVAQTPLSAALFNAIARNGRLKMVLPSTTYAKQDCTYTAYFVRKNDLESGKYKGPASWKGANLALPPPGAQASLGYVSERYLQQAGLSLDDVRLPVVDVAAQPEALSAGQVDIVAAFEPTVSRLRAHDDLAMLMPATVIVPELSSVGVVYGPRLLDDPDVGNRFAVAYLKAVRQYMQGTTPRNVDLIAAFTKLEPDLVKTLCLAAIPAKGELNVASIMDYQNWLVQKGLVDHIVAPEVFLDTRFAEEARRELDGAD